MSATVHKLASGRGWRVSDVVCTAARGERPFEEEHAEFCVAVVTEGTFRYRSRLGAAMMAPGAILLGNPGNCYECGHDHAEGDRCLAFHFAPEFMESVVSGIPGARRTSFGALRLPPLPQLQPLLAAVEAARDMGDGEELEEAGVRLAAAATSLSADTPGQAAGPSPADERRVAEAVRRIERDAERPISLAELADETATSPYHFLRTFRQVAGMTPYQFLLRTRLHRAATRLRTTDEAISAIACDAGFNDLSTFNRRFRKVMGATPGGYRAARLD